MPTVLTYRIVQLSSLEIFKKDVVANLISDLQVSDPDSRVMESWRNIYPPQHRQNTAKEKYGADGS